MIGYAEQVGKTVYVRNPQGGIMWTRTGTLIGYTSDTVAIKESATTYICGEKGEIKFTR